MLGHTHVETSFDFVGISSLEDGPDHCKGTLLSSSINRIHLKSVQTLSDGNQLVIVGRCAVHRDEEREGQVIHLFGEYLAGLEAVTNTRDIVIQYWVATLSHARLGDGLSVDLNGFLMEVFTPIVTLVQEVFVLLVQMPQFVSSVRLEILVQVNVTSEEATGL